MSEENGDFFIKPLPVDCLVAIDICPSLTEAELKTKEAALKKSA